MNHPRVTVTAAAAFACASLLIAPRASASGSVGPAGERAAFEALLAEHADLLDAARAGEPLTGAQERALAELGPELDRLAHQKDAWASGLYWHTDLDAALAEAETRGVPVVSLRLLGSLESDLSCANSRFFRVLLYPDPRVNAPLRERFVLHWQSVADVPRVTVEYADGRRLERTVVGNSMHVALDAQGRVIDAMPGLVGAEAMARWLHGLTGRGVHAGPGRLSVGLAPLPASRDRPIADTFEGRLSDYFDRLHRSAAWETTRTIAMASERAGLPLAEVVGEADAANANSLTFGKSIVSEPLLLALGEEQVAAVLAEPAYREALLTRPPYASPLSPASVALIERKEGPLDDARRAGIEDRLARDTLLNLTELQPRVRDALRNGAYDPLDADAFVAAVYRDVFLMPLDDPWLGLSPADALTAIDGRGERLD